MVAAARAVGSRSCRRQVGRATAACPEARSSCNPVRVCSTNDCEKHSRLRARLHHAAATAPAQPAAAAGNSGHAACDCSIASGVCCGPSGSVPSTLINYQCLNEAALCCLNPLTRGCAGMALVGRGTVRSLQTGL